MADLRWAVMGTGRISLGVLPHINEAHGNRVVAIASRDAARASDAALRAGVERSCTYEELASRPDIDAVYIGLPHHLHAEWSVRLLEAGKHVLCEKPLCATRAEAERVAAAARRAGRICVEGFMYMHHPQTARLIELARAARDPRGANPIGPLRLIRSNRNVRNTDPYILSSRLSHAMQGGALMDIGCYPLSAALIVTGETPDWSTLRASAELGRWVGDASGGIIEKQSGERVPIGPAPANASIAGGWVDETCAFSFRFPSGAAFEGECSFTKGAPAGGSVFFEMIGERGRAFTTHPFGPDPLRQVLTIESGGRVSEEVFERGGDKFVNQFERFAAAARGETGSFPSMEFSIVEAEAIERIHRAVGVLWE